MFIWACPPLSGDDYILYCHPENQKTPKNTKLREWYIKMLKKCEEDGVVLGTSNLYDYYWQMGRAPARPVELPYFEGEKEKERGLSFKVDDIEEYMSVFDHCVSLLPPALLGACVSWRR